VAPTGAVSVVASYATGEAPTGVVVDGLGDLLVAVDQLTVGGRIERFSAGQRSTFASSLFSAVALTVGPDGDVWVIDPIAKLLRRYDPLGTPKSAVSLDDLKFIALHMGLAFSPAGDLYITNGLDAIYRIVNGVPQLVFRGTPTLGALAFDRDGFLYVANPGLGRVILLDPDFHVVQDPFARSYQGGSSVLAFLRDANGAVTSRLVTGSVGLGALASDLGVIAELNPAGVRAPGFRVGADLLHVANAALPDGVVGADYAETLQLVAAPGPALWSVSAGTLPPGLTLSPDGRLAGIPTHRGAFSFAVRAAAGAQLAFKAFTVTVTVPDVSVDAAAADLLGGAPLDLTRRRFLDLQGNRNGNFDIGDFRAFLRANGQLPAAAAGKEQP
jgi:DNA-binding beta-propeller fold protein YncE